MQEEDEPLIIKETLETLDSSTPLQYTQQDKDTTIQGISQQMHKAQNESLFLSIPKESSPAADSLSIASNSTTPTLKTALKLFDNQQEDPSDNIDNQQEDPSNNIDTVQNNIDYVQNYDDNAPLISKTDSAKDPYLSRGSFQERTSQDAARSPHSLPFGLKEEEWVESCAPLTDNPHTPALTFRVILLGLIWSVFLATTNTLFSFRKNHFRIPVSVVVLLAYPMGIFLQVVLPSSKVSSTTSLVYIAIYLASIMQKTNSIIIDLGN